jgi:hypothetical protein
MEMQLNTSGALSRSHYALVQRVEHAASPQEIDLVVLQEIADVRHRLLKGGLTSVNLFLNVSCISADIQTVTTNGMPCHTHVLQHDFVISTAQCIRILPSSCCSAG